MAHGKLITVIVPCRNEEKHIASTISGILRQRAEDGSPLNKWGTVIVIDDESTDASPMLLEGIQRENRIVRVLRNQCRRGIAASYNQAIRETDAPLVLICHADCQPEQEDYIWRAIQHFDREDVAAVTGKPTIIGSKKASFVERAYIVTHVMDVSEERALIRDINFVEGRCDAFRKAALEGVGFYDEEAPGSGEDQVLATALRRVGYRIIQDTSLKYSVSCGNSANSLSRIVTRHVVLGGGQAFVLLRCGLSMVRLSTSPNRRLRAQLRILQVAESASLFLVLASALVWPVWDAVAILGIALAARFCFHLKVAAGRFRPADGCAMFPIALLCDIAYGLGFYGGCLKAVRRRLCGSRASYQEGK